VPSVLAACGGGGGGAAATTAAGTGASAETAAAATTAGNAGREIEVIRFATSGPPRKLDIAGGFDGNSIVATTVGVESLVTYDEAMALQPLLAEQWSQPDPTTYVYSIRPNVTFWDGSPLTAEDVVASLARNRDPSSEINYYFGSVDAIEATGDLEVTVRLSAPDPFFQYVPALVNILPKAFIEEHGQEIGTPQVRTISTGPYTIADYTPDESITWERWNGYWGEQPAVRQLVISFIAEPQTRLLAFRGGEIDGASDLSPADLAQWDELAEADILSTPSLGTWYLSFDIQQEPWSDVHVRRAFAHALDRDGIAQAIYQGAAVAASSLVAPEQWGGIASPDEVEQIYASLPNYLFDLDLAREELRQSIVPGGFEASIVYPSNDPTIGKALLSLAENLRQIGVELTVTEQTEDKWIAKLFAHKNPMGLNLCGIGPDYPDPANYPALCFHSKAAVENGFNTANYSNPEVDRLLQEQATSTDPAVRARAIAETLRIVNEDLPFLPIVWPTVSVAIRTAYRLTNFSAVSVYTSLGKAILPA
jgi:peptide/nickel transport system substrate-binding protein